MQETFCVQTNSFDICMHCSKTFKNCSGLKTHLRRVHKQTFTDYKIEFKLKNPPTEKMLISQEKVRQYTLKKFEFEQKAISEGLNFLRCEICEFKTMSTLLSHIVRRHDMSIEEYKKLYGEQKLQQVLPSIAKKNAIKIKEAMNRPDVYQRVRENSSTPSEIRHWTRKGFSEEEAKIQISNLQRMISLKGNNPRTKAIQSKNSSGDNNPMSLISIARRFGVTLEEAKKLTPGFGRSGEKHPMFGKNHTIEALQKISCAHHLTNPTQRSIPEIQIADFISTLSDSVRFNAGIGRWNVDVIDDVRMIVVEHFGCMWHSHECMGWDNSMLHPIYGCEVSKILDRNDRKIELLNNLGYDVIVVWECDWRKDRVIVMKRIENAFNRTL